MSHRTEDQDLAASAALDAYRECKASAQHCLNARREDGIRKCAGALEDCADASLLLSNLLLRQSPLIPAAIDVVEGAARQAAMMITGLDHANGQLRATYAACQNLLRVCRDLTGASRPAEEDARDEALIETFPASDATPTISHAT